MDEFVDDLKSGEIQFRDRWQFELKSEFLPKTHSDESFYSQEFYFFIPNSLQVNSETYSKEEFYRDLTNFIRFKTPTFSLQELTNQNNLFTPYSSIKQLITENPIDISKIDTELKLFGNIFRSSLRDRIAEILSKQNEEHMNVVINTLCENINESRKKIDDVYHEFTKKVANEKLLTTFRYLNEFISNTLDYFLTGLLDELRQKKVHLSPHAEDILCETILQEKTRYPFRYMNSEEILYRKGLLKKFFMDTLVLSISRSSLQEKYGHFISGVSAGIAMLVYITLFVSFGQAFVITSEPFIILTVIIYILKDRLKDLLKSISYRHALKWFSDFTTHIHEPNQNQYLGEMKESFTFLDEDKISEDIRRIRSSEFHKIMPDFKRPEQVIYFKRSIQIFSSLFSKNTRFTALNILLRFNIQNFIGKASDPLHEYAILEPETREIIHKQLPKVYHLNLILKNTFVDQKNEQSIQLKKFRLIIDKDGIKYIEQLKL